VGIIIRKIELIFGHEKARTRATPTSVVNCYGDATTDEMANTMPPMNNHPRARRRQPFPD
jgi:hypothetical protein